MDLLQSLLLGAIQGATEFLPVSSSGHLVLVPWLLGWPPPSLAFGAVAHWGTAVAVIVCFRSDLARIARALVCWASMAVRTGLRAVGPPSGDARLGFLIALGSIPAAVLGYLLNDFFERMFARPVAAAAFLLVTAAVLAGAERLGRQVVDKAQALSPVDALLIGIGQAAAMLPGVSRSGATIAAGLFRGMERSPAARFSFLLGIPVVVGAGLFEIAHLVSSGGLGQAAAALAIGFAAALGVGIGSIRFLMRQLKRGRLYPYALYCACLGLGCLVVAAVRGM